MKYRVTVDFEIEAEDEIEAAEKAHEIGPHAVSLAKARDWYVGEVNQIIEEEV